MKIDKYLNPSFEDDRGAFIKVFKSDDRAPFSVEQGNLVINKKKGIFRGFHLQKHPFSESKNFNVLKGAIQLGWIDLRSDSAEYSKAFSKILTPSEAIRLPRGLATGYLVLEPNTEVLYFSDNTYSPDHELGIRWDDPLVKIKWEMKPLIVSAKDSSWRNYQL